MSHPHPELGAPPPLHANGLRIVALGGLGEIGRNMTVFEHAGRLLIVDCGVLFPEPDQPGVDLILPDFTAIEDRLDKIEAVVLTHAHEDHIGGDAVPAARSAGHPAGRLEADAGAGREQAHRAPDHAESPRRWPRVTESFGPFDLEFFSVNHSIPDALAVGIRTRAGVVLHTGDFKMDQLPLDGRLTDLGGFARLGAEGVDLLMADSTNAEVPGIVTSERAIGPVLAEVFDARGAADHRVLLRQPRAPGAAGDWTPPRRTAARSRWSAGRWCGTWAWPATSATCRSRRCPAACSWT